MHKTIAVPDESAVGSPLERRSNVVGPPTMPRDRRDSDTIPRSLQLNCLSLRIQSASVLQKERKQKTILEVIGRMEHINMGIQDERQQVGLQLVFI